MEAADVGSGGAQAVGIHPVTAPRGVMLTIPQSHEIERESREVSIVKEGLTIQTHQDYLSAGEKLKSIVRARKQVVELFREAKQAADRAHASVCAAEKKLLDPLKKAEDEYNRHVKSYLLIQRQREQEEAARLRKAAEEEARRKTEELKKSQDDERIRIAQQLHESGFKQEAEQVLAQEAPVVIVAPVVTQPIQKMETVTGQHLRTTYCFIVDDLLLLIQEVAAGRQPISLLLPNQKALDQMARALKKELRIPGGHVEESATLVNKDTTKPEGLQ